MEVPVSLVALLVSVPCVVTCFVGCPAIGDFRLYVLVMKKYMKSKTSNTDSTFGNMESLGHQISPPPPSQLLVFVDHGVLEMYPRAHPPP